MIQKRYQALAGAILESVEAVYGAELVSCALSGSVARESQEIVELATKAMLRRIGIDPPRWHDVGGIILEHRERFPVSIRDSLEKIARIPKRLRKERELSFYGDIDFLPTEEYSREDASGFMKEARLVVETAGQLIFERD